MPRPLTKHEATAEQMAEDPGSAYQVTERQTPRIMQQPVQPLQCRLLHPQRRTLLRARKEIQRRTDAQHQPTRLAPRLQSLRNHFLLRRSYREEAEPEGAVRFDETQAALGRRGVGDESHGRIVAADIRQPVPCGQTRRLGKAASDEHDAISGGCDPTEQLGREIGAGANREARAPDEPHGERHHPAVQQSVIRRAV